MNSTVDKLKVYCKECAHHDYLKKQEYYCKKNSDYILKTKIRAFEILSHDNPIRCAMKDKWKCCNSDDIDFLSIDHIAGDGARHRRQINATASTSIYRWIIKNPKLAIKTMQILCMNAQVKKKKLNGEQKYVRKSV
jgi:hypothetical protein